MSNPEVGIFMLALFLGAVMLGFPIAFTLAAMGIFFGYYAMGPAVFQLFVTSTNDTMANDVLTAVPLFLFMGYMIERANILDRLFYSVQMAARNVPGSLAVATLITCSLFATATGIVGAVVTLMGLLAFPAMLRAGYDVRLASGVVCAGGCLGIMIPPSVLLILYGATAGVSAVRLYAAAMIPGFILTALYVVYVITRVVANPALAPQPAELQKHIPLSVVAWNVLTSFVPLAFLILAVLGAILFGWATPSEAAAVGAVGAMILSVAYRSFTFERLKEAVFLTARTSAMVCFLFVGSKLFSSIFAYLGGHEVVEKWFTQDLNLNTVGFMIVTQFIIFLLGWPLEWTEIIIIFVPIFLPLLKTFDVDPVLFGVLVALNMQTSFNTPPVAMACYYLKGVSPPWVKLTDIFAGALPYVFLVFICMTLIYVFPDLALGLPRVLYDR